MSDIVAAGDYHHAFGGAVHDGPLVSCPEAICAPFVTAAAATPVCPHIVTEGTTSHCTLSVATTKAAYDKLTQTEADLYAARATAAAAMDVARYYREGWRPGLGRRTWVLPTDTAIGPVRRTVTMTPAEAAVLEAMVEGPDRRQVTLLLGPSDPDAEEDTSG